MVSDNLRVQIEEKHFDRFCYTHSGIWMFRNVFKDVLYDALFPMHDLRFMMVAVYEFLEFSNSVSIVMPRGPSTMPAQEETIVELGEIGNYKKFIA